MSEIEICTNCKIEPDCKYGSAACELVKISRPGEPTPAEKQAEYDRRKYAANREKRLVQMREYYHKHAAERRRQKAAAAAAA